MMDMMLIMKVAKIITALTSIHVASEALGYDFCKKFHGFKFYLDILAGIAGILVLARFFMQ